MGRSYNQYCGVAAALDVSGERWTLLIVRNLLLGPLRYTELLRGLPGITTNLLAKRLREMEEAGLIERVQIAPGDGSGAYRLTDDGYGLEPSVHALGRWGWRRLSLARPGQHRSFEWLLVALRRRYRGGEDMTAEIVADGTPYRFELSADGARIGRGSSAAPDVRLRGSATDFVRLFLEGWGGTGIEVDGSQERAKALVAAFERGDPPELAAGRRSR